MKKKISKQDICLMVNETIKRLNEVKGGKYDITFRVEKMFQNFSMGFTRQRQVIVIVNGEEMSVDKVNFIIQMHYINDATYYQPHILIAPDYQHKGLGYAIYAAFIRTYGNLYSQHWMRANNEEMPRIWEKLKSEPDIMVGEDENCYVAIRKDLVE